MQIVTTIRTGHRVVTETATYEVYGALKMRGGYKYLVVNVVNRAKSSIDRNDLLQAQREGSAKIT